MTKPRVSGFVMILFIFFAGVSSKAAREVPVLSEPVLIVVHAQSRFDSALQAKRAIDREVRQARKTGRKVIYLLDGNDHGYTADRRPDFRVASSGGEHRLPLRTPDVELVGGYFGTYDNHRGCFSFALRNVVNSYFNLQGQTRLLSIRVPLAAVYFWTDDLELRKQLLKNRLQDSKAVDRLIQLLFTQEEGGELELGRAEFRPASKSSGVVTNPFVESSEGTLEASQEPGKKVMDYELYTQDLPIGVSSYRFQIYYKGKLARSFGNGSREVRLILDP